MNSMKLANVVSFERIDYTNPPVFKNRHVLCALLFLFAFMPSMNAYAIPAPPWLSAGVDLSGPGGPINHDSGIVIQPTVSETNTLSQVSAHGSTATGSGSASADGFGNLKVLASAGVTMAPGDPVGINSNAGAVASHADTFHFLPAPGTSISFLATLEWSGQFQGQCPVGSECIVNIINRLNDLGHGGAATMSNDFFYDSTDPNHNILPPGTQRLEKVMTFNGPASFDWVQELIVSFSVVGHTSSASFSADMSHTGHFYLDPITPGATYTTASGNLYFSPTVSNVPLPATFLLFGSALAGFIGITRRDT